MLPPYYTTERVFYLNYRLRISQIVLSEIPHVLSFQRSHVTKVINVFYCPKYWSTFFENVLRHGRIKLTRLNGL